MLSRIPVLTGPGWRWRIWGTGLSHADRPGGVLGEEAFDLVDRAGLDSCGEDDAGVRDEDVDLAGILDGGVDAGLVGHVQAQPLVDVKAVRVSVAGVLSGCPRRVRHGWDHGDCDGQVHDDKPGGG